MGSAAAHDRQRPARRRVAVCGYAHEVNALAAPIRLKRGIDEASLPSGLAASWAGGPVLERLRELRGDDVEIVELPTWELGASGPLDGDDFRTLVAELDARLDAQLEAGGPVDAVVVLGHGAGQSTDDTDTDATYLEALRRRVGNDVAVVAVLDFHANVSARMCAAVDVVVGYRTNPHVDVVDCSLEAADHVHRLLGAPDAPSPKPTIVWSPLPVLLPQIAQLTTPGEPFHEVMAEARRLEQPPIHNVSVFGGFSLGANEHCGLSVCLSVDAGHEALAADAVRTIADRIWQLRDRYRMHTTPLADAVPIAVAAGRGERPPVLLADVADNPGGGAPATSTFVLDALLGAGATGVVMSMHCDRHVVDAAWAAGLGARLQVTFNAASTHPLALELTVDATVVGLQDAELVPTRGVYAGSPRRAGRCCALDLGGVAVAVSSYPVQCADDSTFHHVGLRPEAAQVVVVKSRGHFRAGFDHLFADEHIVEVGAPGVAPSDLGAIDPTRLGRPRWPIDPVEWRTPDPIVADRSADGALR
jgi:microcystin degradation protein MlrC